jgi:hypothetical protein
MGEDADGGIASLNWLTENHIADPSSVREKYDERLHDRCDGCHSFGTKRYWEIGAESCEFAGSIHSRGLTLVFGDWTIRCCFTGKVELPR